MAFNINEYVKTDDYIGAEGDTPFLSALIGSLVVLTPAIAAPSLRVIAIKIRAAVAEITSGKYLPVKTTAEADKLTRRSVYAFPNIAFLTVALEGLTESDLLSLVAETETSTGNRHTVNDETSGGTTTSESTRATTATDKYNPVNTVSGRVGNESEAQETASGSTRTTGERGATGTEDTTNTTTRNGSIESAVNAYAALKNVLAEYAIYFSDNFCYTEQELEDGYYFGVID